MERDLKMYESDVETWDAVRLDEELDRLTRIERNWKQVIEQWGIGTGQFLLAGAKIAIVQKYRNQLRTLTKGRCHVRTKRDRF